MQNIFLTVLHLLTCFLIIALVLMQHGKGADAGAAFGSGGSGTVFGASGSSNFLSRATRWGVTIFFATSLAFMFFTGRIDRTESVLDRQSNEVPVLSIPQSEVPQSTAPSDEIK